jgi:hypothetical protein
MTQHDENETKEKTVYARTSTSRSVFAPVVLIAAGVFFLLDNLNYLPTLNWEQALRFWPLFLIFIGLNVLVVQFKRPWGTIMSLIVALVAVAVFGYLLLSGNSNPVFNRLGITAPTLELKEESFNISAAGVNEAEIQIEFGNFPARIESLSNESSLVSGTLFTLGEPEIESNIDSAGRARVLIGEKSNQTWFLNPAGWTNQNGLWEIGLNPAIPMILTLDAGNGSVDAHLAALNLAQLTLDGGNGSLTVILPAGNYDLSLDGSNGQSQIALPAGGRQELTVDGGNGGISVTLPSPMQARVEYDRGSGGITVDSRFSLISGDKDKGVYQTSGYENASNRVMIALKTGNGRFEISEP